MKQILLPYGLPKVTATVLMILHKNNMKTMLISPEGDTEFFNVLSGVLQEDILASCMFIICLNYVLRTSIDLKVNDFTKK